MNIEQELHYSIAL